LDSGYIQQKSLDQIDNLSNLTEIVNLPTELFNPYRLIILNYLNRLDFLSFTQLKDLTQIESDGNLASHLRFLENNGYISVHKSFAGRYPKRFYELTNEGKKTVEHLAIGLSAFLEKLLDV